MRTLCRPISLLLSAILAVGSLLQAQSAIPSGGGDPQELRIRIIEGEHSQAQPGRLSEQPLTVAVTDGQGAPVPSATVLFRLPSDGPTGVFGDGSRVSVLYTDLQGQATVKNIQWGALPGTAVIRITATKGTAHAGLLLEQTLAPKGSATTVTAQTEAPKPAAPQRVEPGAAPQIAKLQPAQPAQPAQPQPAQQQKTDSSEQPGIATSTGAALASSTPAAPPSVVISTNTSPQITGASGKSHKWLWIGIGVAAAAGAAFAFAGKKGSSNSPTSTSSSTSIGTPTISIGHP